MADHARGVLLLAEHDAATLTVREKPQTSYRALLISEVDFPKVCMRNEGDVQLMRTMLSSVKGPTGGSYSIRTAKNSTPTQVRQAIASTFAGADDDDVSLFFIATHGDIDHSGDGAGALETVSGEYIPFGELASWLNAVPGKVIVIVESCGSGACVYSSSAAQNALQTQSGDGASDEFTQKLIDAFADIDSAQRGASPNTGELRVSGKFYVLTASRYQEESWGLEPEIGDAYNYFTKWLTDGVGLSGSMPADQMYGGNLNGIVELEELFKYISAVGDNHGILDEYGFYHYQHVQRYPENSSYMLFRR